MEINRHLAVWGYENPYPVGSGAFARVYRVREKVTGRIFACKVSGEKEMLKRESVVLQQIEHPLFPAFHEWRETEGKGFLFMEYIFGTTIKSLIERRGELSERQAVRIGTELAEGLCYLHERNTPIIFRDVKPENILIREDGAVMLVDLGSAAWDAVSRTVITGTEGYAAPEQWQDTEKVGSYSDVYALGKILYFVLGKRKISCGLAELLEDCVCTDIKKRVPDMRCFMSRLRFQKSDYCFQRNVVKL